MGPVIALLLVGCGRPAEPEVWEAIDVAAIEANLAQPTASRAEVVASLVVLEELLQMSRELDRMPETALEPALAGPEAEQPSTEDVVAGTSVFVQIACVGPGTAPDPDFAFGQIELQSPIFLEQDLTPIVGPLLLDFATCTSADVTIDGAVRATWLASEQRLLIAGGLVVITSTRTTGATIEADLRPDLLQLGVPLADGTAVIELTDTTAVIRFADGVVQCSADGSSPCELDP